MTLCSCFSAVMCQTSKNEHTGFRTINPLSRGENTKYSFLYLEVTDDRCCPMLHVHPYLDGIETIEFICLVVSTVRVLL